MLLQGLDVPFDRCETERRAAAALAMVGRREDAVEHLVAAHRTARRLGARPLVERLTASLTALGERPDRRLGRQAVAQAANSGLTRREVEVVRLVALATPTGRSPVACSSAPAPSRCTSAASCSSSTAAPGPTPPSAPASSACWPGWPDVSPGGG